MANTDFGVILDVDASRAVNDLRQVRANATEAAAGVAKLGSEMKKLASQGSGTKGGSWLAENDLGKASKSMSANVGAMKQSAAAAKELGQAFKSLDGVNIQDAAGKVGRALQAMSAEMGKTTLMSSEHVKALRQQVALYKDLAQASANLGRAHQLNQSNSASGQAAQQAASGTRAYEQALRQQAQAAQQAVAANKAQINSLDSVRFSAGELQRHYAAIGVAAASLSVLSVKSAADQQRAYADVARTTQAGSVELNELRESYRNLSTEINTSFEELSKIGSLGAQMGITTDDLDDFASAVAKFSTLTGETIESTAEEMGRLYQFLEQAQASNANFVINGKEAGQQYEQLASQVAQLGVNAVSTEGEILKMANSIAASTTGAGFGQDATLGYATALTSMGVRAEWARGSMQRMFGQINAAAADGAGEMTNYARVLGVTEQAAYDMWKSNPEEFFYGIIKAVAGAKDGVEQYSIIQDELGIKATRDKELIKRLAQNIGILESSLKDATEAGKNTDFLDKSMGILNDTLLDTLGRMRNAFKNMMAEFGEPFLMPLKALAEGLTGLMNTLANVDKRVAAAAGGFAAFIAARAGMKVLQVTVLNVASSIQQIKAAQVEAGLSGTLSWKNIYLAIKQAHTALNQYSASVARLSVAQKALSMGGATAAGGGASAAQMAALSRSASAAAPSVAAVGNAASSMGNSVAAASTKVSGLGSAFSGMRAAGNLAMGAMGGPWGVALAAIATALPVIIEQYNQWSRSAEIAAEKSAEAAKKTATEMGGSQKLLNAIVQDTMEVANGQQTAATELTVRVDETKTSLEDSTTAAQYWVTAQGEVVRASAETANALGYMSMQLGDNTKKLAADQMLMSEAVTDMKATIRQELLDMDFNFGDFIQASARGEAAGEAYVQGFINKIEPEIKSLEAQLAPLALMSPAAKWTDWFDPLLPDSITDIKDRLAHLKEQREALQNMKDDHNLTGAIADAASQAEIAAQTMNGLGIEMDETGASADGLSGAMDAAGNAVGGAGDKAMTAADAWDAFENSMHKVVDAAFGMINTEAELYNSLDRLNQSIAENGNTMDYTTQQGRANVQALQEYIQSVIGLATQAAQEMGLVGAEAQRYVAGEVQAAIDYLQSQGIDTSHIDTTIDNLYNALGQPVPGMTVDFSQMNAQLNQAIADAQAAANAIRAIMGSVGGVTSGGRGGSRYNQRSPQQKQGKSLWDKVLGFVRGGSKTVRPSGSSGRSSGGWSTGMSASSSSAMSSATAAGVGAALKRYTPTLGQAVKKWTPAPVRSSGGGGGGGRSGGTPRSTGSSPRSSSGSSPRSSGSGSRSSRNEKSAQEQFEDFLNRLNQAMKKAVDGFWQQQDANDAYHSQLNKMRKSIADTKKSISDLKKGIEDLNRELKDQLQELHDSEYFNAIAKKYGDTERIRSTQNDVDNAKAKVADTRSQISEKQTEIKGLEAGLYNLKGYTDAAIENRAALRALQNTMVDLVNAYAATGASSEQVRAYAMQLKNQFVEQAVSMGYNRAEVLGFAGAFDHLGQAIASVPRVVETGVVDTGSGVGGGYGGGSSIPSTTGAVDDLAGALGALPSETPVGTTDPGDTWKTGYGKVEAYKSAIGRVPKNTVATVDDKQTINRKRNDIMGFLQRLLNIPKTTIFNIDDRGSLRRLSQAASGALNQINRLPSSKAITMTWYNRVINETINTVRNFVTGGTRRNEGGPVGFASGGLVPGRPPANPRLDNLWAMTQHGSVYGIRSGEFVMSQPAVDYYGEGIMKAMNERRMPVNSPTGNAGMTNAVISDASLMQLARAVSSVITLDGQAISQSTNNHFAVAGKRGAY